MSLTCDSFPFLRPDALDCTELEQNKNESAHSAKSDGIQIENVIATAQQLQLGTPPILSSFKTSPIKFG